MAKKSEKYIVTELARPDLPLPTDKASRVLWLDNEVVKDAFYFECIWFWPRQEPAPDGGEEHTHDFDEIIAFFGTNPEDPHDLGGEIELWLDGEQHIITKSFLAFVPAGMKHSPLRIRRVDRPIFHLTTGPGTSYQKLFNQQNPG